MIPTLPDSVWTPRAHDLLKSLANLLFVAVDLGGVDVTVSVLEDGIDDLLFAVVEQECSKSNDWLFGAIIESECWALDFGDSCFDHIFF